MTAATLTNRELGKRPTSDEALMKRACSGDREAFEELYERYLPRVYRLVARHLPSQSDSEATVEAVLVRLFAATESPCDVPLSGQILQLTRLAIAEHLEKPTPVRVAPAAEVPTNG